MSRVHNFDPTMSVSNPETQTRIPYKYMVEHLKSFRDILKSYFGSHLGCHHWVFKPDILN